MQELILLEHLPCRVKWALESLQDTDPSLGWVPDPLRAVWDKPCWTPKPPGALAAFAAWSAWVRMAAAQGENSFGQIMCQGF